MLFKSFGMTETCNKASLGTEDSSFESVLWNFRLFFQTNVDKVLFFKYTKQTICDGLEAMLRRHFFCACFYFAKEMPSPTYFFIFPSLFFYVSLFSASPTLASYPKNVLDLVKADVFSLCFKGMIVFHVSSICST